MLSQNLSKTIEKLTELSTIYGLDIASKNSNIFVSVSSSLFVIESYSMAYLMNCNALQSTASCNGYVLLVADSANM